MIITTRTVVLVSNSSKKRSSRKNNTIQVDYVQVYGYRMSLWAEHLGMLQDCFKEPEHLSCVRSVNQIAQDNWKRFTAEEFTRLQGHLLRYPVEIDVNGKVGPLPGQETFPDVGGKVLGCPTTLPDALTT